jgi:hypothetical protein
MSMLHLRRGATRTDRRRDPGAAVQPVRSRFARQAIAGPVRAGYRICLEAAARLRVRCGYRPASVERATRVGVLDDLGLRIGGLFDDNVPVMSLDDLFRLEDLVAVDDREPA